MSTDKQSEKVDELAGRLAAVWSGGGARVNPHPGEADQWRAVARFAIELLTAQPGPVDRDGLANVFQPVLGHDMAPGHHSVLAGELADAAIAYMGAQPVDETAAKNWQLSYDKACRERDECKAELAEAKKAAQPEVATKENP